MRFACVSVSVSVFLASVAGAGCGGGGGSSEPLDCAWLDGDNCWKTTAGGAASCLPPEAETGVFSDDLRTCTYANGTVVTFDSPLVLPLDFDTDLRFTITSGGTTCVRFEETETTLDLTVLGQTYRQRPSGGLGIAVTCPDGTSYSNGNVFELLDCAADGGVLELPGTSWSTGDDYLTFYFISVSNETSSSLQAFDCRRAIASSASSAAPTTPEARRTFTRRTGGPRR